MKPQDRAEASAAALLAEDAASRSLGITLEHVAPGFAAMTMRVEDWLLNGHGICHGGFVFTLADTAFAVACNSYNRRVVAQHNVITYLAPGLRGTTLRAEAIEISRTGRSGLYDVSVWDGQTKIAEFRGASREVSGRHFNEAEG
ncbi:hydroxyphenylacetyl-CoA thioesterase PaaI [Tropicimonas sp. S265A]|uniref:hydroxyphenylacetyl-CoA thioesterase PaaI n=1 Tax=Tropicimonas sp. S265A TaxID=3415134 RepID=UPI003C7D7C18